MQYDSPSRLALEQLFTLSSLSSLPRDLSTGTGEVNGDFSVTCLSARLRLEHLTPQAGHDFLAPLLVP